MSAGNAVELQFESIVYSLDTLKRAAYPFLERCAFDFSVDGSRINCVLTFPHDATSISIADLVRDFKAEVLDQDLRKAIAEETATTRNAILAYAFSKTGFQSGV